MVHGYHVYREIWEAAVGQSLPCQQAILTVRTKFHLVLLPSSHAAFLERTARVRFKKESYNHCYTVLCYPFPI